MKRIVIFSTAYFPLVGGAEVAIKEITDRIDSYEFLLITPRYKKEYLPVERVGNVMVYRVGTGHANDKYLLPFFGLVKLIQLSLKRYPDAFWGMMVTYATGIAYLFNVIFYWRRVPVILTLQEGDSEEYIASKKFGIQEYIWRPILSLFTLSLPTELKKKATGLIAFSWIVALQRTTMVTVISTYLKKRAREFGYKGHVELVPNGVDTKHFSKEYSYEEIDQLKVKLDKKMGDVFLITTSRLTTKNAVDDVIRAMKLLKDNIHFLVLGVGNDEQMLKDLAKSEGVENRVHFLGLVAHDEMPKYLKVSDIFIRPSLSEGFGNSFIEAMAVGIPVIATQEGGISDFLYDPEKNPEIMPTGRAVLKRDPEGIARAVNLIINEPGTTHEIISNAKRMVFEKYDWSLIARTMKEKVFDRI